MLPAILLHCRPCPTQRDPAPYVSPRTLFRRSTWLPRSLQLVPSPERSKSWRHCEGGEGRNKNGGGREEEKKGRKRGAASRSAERWWGGQLHRVEPHSVKGAEVCGLEPPAFLGRVKVLRRSGRQCRVRSAKVRGHAALHLEVLVKVSHERDKIARCDCPSAKSAAIQVASLLYIAIRVAPGKERE